MSAIRYCWLGRLATAPRQGLDLFGGGGCANPMLALTDTLVLTIG